MKVCRVCLAMGVKMYHMSEHNLSLMYDQVAGFKINTEDNLPKMLCWECVARLSSAYNFIKKALKTHLILVDKLKSSRFISMGDIELIDKTKLESTLGVKIYRENFCNVHIIKDDNINEHFNNEEEQIFVTDISVEKDPIKLEYLDGTEEQKGENEYNIKADIDNEIKFQNVDFKIEPNEVIENEYVSNKTLIDNESYASENSKEDKHIVNEWSEVDLSKQGQKRKYNIKKPLSNKTSEELPRCKELRVLVEDIMLSPTKHNTQDSFKYLTEAQSTNDNNMNFSQGTINENSIFKDENNSVKTKTCSTNTVKVSKYIDTVCKNSSVSDPVSVQSVSVNNKTSKTSISKHTNNTVFTCDVCTFESSVKTRFKYHIYSKHSKCSFNCAHCDFVSNVKSRLVGHINSKHTKDIVFNCSYCSFNTYFKGSIDRYINSKHTKNNIFNCSYCSYKTYIKNNLNTHTNTKHTKNNVFNCSLCDFKTYDKRYLKGHINSQHTKTEVSNCSLCNYKAYNKDLLKGHINAKHTKTDVFNCSSCDYKTYKKGNLKDHINAIHTKVNVFTCSYCSFKSHKKSNVNVHVNAKHTKILSFNCSFCKYKAYNKMHLKGHMNANHTKANVFICSYCNFQVFYKANLIRHIKAKYS